MARDEAPPFARGETWYNGSAKDPALTDPTNLLGKEYVFEVNAQDQVTGYPPTSDAYGRLVRVRVTANASGANLLPKRVARYKLGSGEAGAFGCRVDGYVFQASDVPAGVVDEFLPPAGVPDGDLFYLIVEGPTVVKSLSGSMTAVAVGDKIEVGTGTSVLHADAGRVNKFAASPVEGDELDRIGRADAVVSATDADLPCVVNFLHLR